MVYLLCALAIINAILLWYYYNDFVSLEYDVEESKAQIDTQLQRRKNILLNLTTMVEDYAKHEKLIFKDIAEIRAALLTPNRKQQAAPDDPPGNPGAPPIGLDAVFSKFLAIAESYPALRLNENFERFMDALVDAENKIADERMTYNERANDMSTAIKVFPGNIFAWLYGFTAPPFFEPESEARHSPNVRY